MSMQNDTEMPNEDADAVMLRKVMMATGLPKETVEGFLMTDSDLDNLCETILSELAVPSKKVAISDR